MMITTASTYQDSKQHYPILDGLRGVAAIVVVLFHVLEIFSHGDHAKQLINHGYLAVDFFFMLSGFVIGYAYDDRWGAMSYRSFAARRLIRLHPMIVFGMLFGAALFYFQGGVLYPAINNIPVTEMLIILAIGVTLLPITPAMDIRGWAEMHPLNGPAWSLLLEYVGNVAYALVLRHLPNRALMALCVVGAGLLLHMSVSRGDLIGGWSFNAEQLRVGFTRLFFPFVAGLLLSRTMRIGDIKGAFGWASAILVVVMSLPWIGPHDVKWMNGLYDAAVVILVFPVVLYIGASGTLSGGSAKLSRWLGDISYPLYITHYPIMYVFMAWASEAERSVAEILPVAGVAFVASLLVAQLSLSLYDIKVRAWLSEKFI